MSKKLVKRLMVVLVVFSGVIFVSNAYARDLKKDSNEERLMLAIDKENIPEIKKIIENGVDINYLGKSEIEVSPLMLAVERDNLEIVTLILGAGADIDLGKFGLTPLFISMASEDLEVFIFLIKKGANVNTSNLEIPSIGRNLTPLMIAALGGNSKIVSILLENGADPKLKSYLGGFDGTLLMPFTAAEAARLVKEEKVAKLIESYVGK